jgi:molybdopterin-guanine dinucleotide biosynthesis protein A
MGRDKAALLLTGRTLLARAVELVREAGGEPLVVGPVSVQALVPGCRRVDEAEGPGRSQRAGPLPALRHGLATCGTRKALALACDLPFLPAALLRFLIDEADRYDAVVPRTAGHLQVLAAAYTTACVGAIDRQLDAGERATHRFLEGVSLRVIEERELMPFGGAEIFFNVNRPEDLARAEARIAGKRA